MNSSSILQTGRLAAAAIVSVLLLGQALQPVSAQPQGVSSFPGSDGRITYVGRTLAQGDEVTFDWTATTVRLRFKGDYLAARFSDTGKDYYNIWVDKEPCAEPDRVVAVFGRDSLVVLFEEAAPAAKAKSARTREHSLVLSKRTEGEQGKTTVHAVLCRDLLQAGGVRPRVMEFVGDSNACGFGSENSVASDPYTKETQNSSKTFCAILGRYFGADTWVIAHSGMGIDRNYNDKLRGYCMPERYLNVFDDGFDRRDDTPRYVPDPGGPRPGVTVVYLAANDFSVGRQPSKENFVRRYIQLLREIKDYWGEDHPVVCVSSRPAYYQYVQEAVERSGMKRIAFLGLGSDIFGPGEKGASHHPSYAAHRKIAHALLPYVSTMSGWPLEDKPLL